MKTLLNTHEAADFLGCSTRTLERYRQYQKGPAHYRYGRRVRYKRQELQSYIESHKILD